MRIMASARTKIKDYSVEVKAVVGGSAELTCTLSNFFDENER